MTWSRITLILGSWLLLCGLATGLACCAQKFRPDAQTPPKPTVPKPPTPPSQAPAATPADDLAQLRAERDALRGSLAKVNAQITTLETERDLAPLRALCRWAAYIGAAASLAGVAWIALTTLGAALWPALALLPIGWKAGAVISITGAVVTGASLGLAKTLPWIGVVGLIAVVAVLLIALGWAAYTWKRGGLATAQQWLTYASHIDDRVRTELDRTSRKVQGKAAPAVDHLLTLATRK